MRCNTLLLICLTGCAPVPQGAPPVAPLDPSKMFELQYDFQLASVERPANARDKYGPQTVTTVADSGRPKFRFEDRLISVIVVPSGGRIALEMTNKTDHSIKVLWNDATFVDVIGASSPVMHVGVRYSECRAIKSSAVIVQKSSISDEAIPCSNLRLREGRNSGWYVEPLLQGPIAMPADTGTEFASRQTFAKSHVKLLLPLQVEDVTNEYLFDFAVSGSRSVHFNLLEGKVP